MKNLKVGLSLIGLVLVGVGAALAITNPDDRLYSAYATEQLTVYLQENACGDVDPLLRDPCKSLLANNQDAVRDLVEQGTQRENYWLFSIYKTNLTPDRFLPSFLQGSLPSYHFETAALFNTFQTYKAEKRN